MKPTEFVTKLRERVIENNMAVYEDILDSTTDAKDPFWREILPIYRGLSGNQQTAFLRFLRMVQVNTLSHVLGVLDGSTTLSENVEVFILKSKEEDEESINGDLQDIFLEMEEI